MHKTYSTRFITKKCFHNGNGVGKSFLGLGSLGEKRYVQALHMLICSLAAAPTRPQSILVTGSALEGFEGVREAVAEHRHFAAMARRARDEGEASATLARLGVLHPL